MIPWSAPSIFGGNFFKKKNFVIRHFVIIIKMGNPKGNEFPIKVAVRCRPQNEMEKGTDLNALTLNMVKNNVVAKVKWVY